MLRLNDHRRALKHTWRICLFLFLLLGCSGGSSNPPVDTSGDPADTAPIVPVRQAMGIVRGMPNGEQAVVILGNDEYLTHVKAMPDGSFRFPGVPDGTYFIKAEINGYKTSKAQHIVIEQDADTQSQIEIIINRLSNETFTFHWEEDASNSGHQETSIINEQQSITFLGESVEIAQTNAAFKLLHDYHIALSNEEVAWHQEYAYRLLETLKQIPQPTRDSYAPQHLKASKWILTDRTIANDIQVQRFDEGNSIYISTEAFVHADPVMVKIDGVKGKFFSKKLHHALVRYVTNDGKDASAVLRILEDRYGCTTSIPDFTALTLNTTGEDENSFKPFHPEELVQIITMFEEMPSGYHAIDGLDYLVRRADGMPHPLYGQIPAVAWPEAHYIEFMDNAFLTDIHHTHKLILHEKSHFMWANLFPLQLKEDWIELGGWYPNAEDPDGWSTTKTAEFVSAYAHAKNPNEDMAESVAHFIMNPDKLRSRSPSKYDFIRDRVMFGNLYVSMINASLTFEVLNLYPDYDYPGKINSVDIWVSGSPQDNKTVTVEIGLHTQERLFDGASRASCRIHSSIGTFVDLHLYPQNDDGSVLRGSFVLSKFAKAGFWFPDQIKVLDKVGNQRLEGVDDFGWKLYVDNPLEDVSAPQYVADSLSVVMDGTRMIEGREVQVIKATWDFLEDNSMVTNSPAYASLTNPGLATYRLENYGELLDENTAQVTFLITEYHPSGWYGVPFLSMRDAALNEGVAYFSASPNHHPLESVQINTANPDTEKPEVELNTISIHAEPTRPEAPDGETNVHITYFARDDKSGVGKVTYRLLDPQGLSHFEYHYHDNFYTLFFEGDPTAWGQYDINVVLPKGSAPGIWGLQTLTVVDKAHNAQEYNFVETMHFEVVQN